MNVHNKEGVILGLMVTLFVVAWLLFAGAYFGATNATAVAPWVFVALAFLAYAVALTVEIDRKHWLIGTLIAGLSPVPFFLPAASQGSPLYTIVGSVVLFLFLYWGAAIGAQERADRVTIKLRRILPRGLGRALTGFALAIALFFLASPLSAIDAPKLEIPPQFLGGVLLPAARTIGVDIPPEVADLTVDEMSALLAYIDGKDSTIITDRTLNVIRERGVGNEVDVETVYAILGDDRAFDAVRADLRRSIEETSLVVLQERRQELSDRVGVELLGDETVGTVFGAAFSEAYLQPRALEDVSGVVPILLATTLFAGVRIVGILVMWVVIVLTWLLLLVLRAWGIVRVEKIAVEKERFVL